MTMMTAGSAAAYAACEGVLEAMAGKVYRLGDRAGAGSKVKIINQLLAGVHIAAAAEAMALGLREGVDADALYEVITHSAGNSWMFENRMAHVLAGDYAPLSAVDIFVRIWGWCWTRPVTANSRCRWRPPRTRCSCKRPPPAMAARTTARSSRSSGHPSAGGEMSIKLGCIADDFTGATDLANNLVRAGMRAVQTIGVPGGALRADADAVVVALKTRSLPADEAVAQSLAALAWLRAQGAEQIYFKYCSTFDSTPQGNIGPVTDALMARLGTDFTIATPAFPDNRRTVFKGYLFVGDVLLNESGMQHHPLTPMTDPNLLRVLAAQTRRKVGLIDHAVVARGSAAIRERIAALRAEGVEIAIVDAVSNDDLLALGPALKGMPLVTAGSGVAIGLPANWALTPGAATASVRAAGAQAVVAGSCSAATNGQVAAFIASGRPALALDPCASPLARTWRARRWRGRGPCWPRDRCCSIPRPRRTASGRRRARWARNGPGR